MGAIDKINADYALARAKWVDANGWMAAHGGSLVWGIAGLLVGFALGLAF